MSNSKHNTLKRLAMLIKKHDELFIEFAERIIPYDKCMEHVDDLIRECFKTEVPHLKAMLINIKWKEYDRNNEYVSKLSVVANALELAIYKLAWGKESFNGLVDSLIKSDYDESK